MSPERPRIPPPTVCTHPRRYWVATGSVVMDSSGSRSTTLGWNCGVCRVWIPNDASEALTGTVQVGLVPVEKAP